MKSIEKIGKLYCHFPQLVTLAGVRAEGKDNLIPLAWFSPVSFDPPLVCILVAPKRFSHDLIVRAGSFTLNFIGYGGAELVKELGSTSGRDLDKFEAFDVPKLEAEEIDAPIMGTAYGALECKLVDRRTYGDHTLFVGEILRTHFLEEAFDENKVLDTSEFQPVLYLGKDTYVTVDHESRVVIPR
jgi:flavin reductase (DIM6/NTAB) family NADH-FMN oxidoreductase RutF